MSLYFQTALRDQCVGNNEKCIFETGENFRADGKGNATGFLISHVGYLLISGTDDFIEFSAGEMEGRANRFI